MDDLELADIIRQQPGRDTRQAWAEANAETITQLLRSPSLTDAAQRLWRLRYWQDGDYLHATMVQKFDKSSGTHTVSLYVVRPYHHVIGLVGMTGRSTVQLDLAGQYSAHEIVAFLRLDLIDPDDVTWHYDSPGRQIVTAATATPQVQDLLTLYASNSGGNSHHHE